MNRKNSPSEKIRKLRRRYTPEQIQGLLQAQPSSGLSATQYCKAQGIHPSLFYAWRKRPRTDSGPAPGKAPVFAGFSLQGLLGQGWIAELALANGTVLRIDAAADPLWIGRLVTQLAGPC